MKKQMNKFLSLKNYTGIHSGVYLTYFLVFLPIISIILQSIYWLIFGDTTCYFALSGITVLLMIAFPTTILCFDLYPALNGDRKFLHIKQSFKTYPELFIFLLFVVYSLIASIIQQFVIGPTNAISLGMGKYSICEGILFFIYYAICMLVSFSITEKKLARNVIISFLGVATFVMLLSVVDPQGVLPFHNIHNTTWASFFINSNHYGYYLSLVIGAVSVVFVLTETKWLKWASLGSLILCSVVLMFNDTLGTLLASLVTLTILPFVLWLFKGKFKPIYLVPLGIFVLSSVLISFISFHYYSFYTPLYKQIGNLLREFGVIASEPTSTEAMKAGTNRWGLWSGAWEQAMQSPIIGTGDVLYRPHNEYLQIFLVWGLPSLLIYLTTFGFIFVKAIKYKKRLSNLTLVCLFACGCYLMSAFCGNTMPHTYPFFMMFLGLTIRWLNNDIHANNLPVRVSIGSNLPLVLKDENANETK